MLDMMKQVIIAAACILLNLYAKQFCQSAEQQVLYTVQDSGSFVQCQ